MHRLGLDGPDNGTCQQEEFEEAGDQVGESDNPFAADLLLPEDVYCDCCQNHTPPESGRRTEP